MARPARALHLPLHADIMFMAERRGRLLRKAHKAAPEARRLRLGRRPASRHQPLRRRTQHPTKTLYLDRSDGTHSGAPAVYITDTSESNFRQMGYWGWASRLSGLVLVAALQ